MTYPVVCKAGLDKEMVPCVHGLEVKQATPSRTLATRQGGPPHLPRSGVWRKGRLFVDQGVKSSSPLGHLLGQQLKVFHPRDEIFQWKKTVVKVIELLFDGVRWR